MTGLMRVGCGLLVAVAVVAPARADEQAEARKVIDKAIKAHGGAEALSKHTAVTTKAKGRYYGMGEGIDFTGNFSTQGSDRYRFEVSMTIMNQQFTIVQAFKGDKGWSSLNGKADDLPKDAVAELREGARAQEVGRLACLSGKEYKLSPLGEVTVEKRPTVGVHVEFKGRRDINLFFDKESGLLVKTETRAKDVMMGDQEFTVEVYMSEYKKVGGAMVAHKAVIKRDGKLFVESETTEFTPSDKLDDAIFAKP